MKGFEAGEKEGHSLVAVPPVSMQVLKVVHAEYYP